MLHPHVPHLPHSLQHRLHQLHAPLHAVYFGCVAIEVHYWYGIAAAFLMILTVLDVFQPEEA